MTNSINSIRRKLISIVSAAAVLCFIFSLTIGSPAAEAEDAYDLNEYAKEIAVLVNEARAENGLDPVYVLPYLNDCAKLRARECTEIFDHKRPDGSKFSTVIDKSLTPYAYAAENIAAGSSSPQATFNQWKNSSRHWAAILNPSITHMGVGVAYEPNSSYRWYWSQIFIQTTAENGDLNGQYIPERYDIVPKSTGDLNGDSVVDSFDYVVLTEYLERKQNHQTAYLNDLQLEAADCFKDNQVTEADAKALQRYILGEYDQLPFVF